MARPHEKSEADHPITSVRNEGTDSDLDKASQLGCLKMRAISRSIVPEDFT
jgi:hypothetical protein